MKKIAYALLTSIGLAAPVLAEVPVYRDRTLVLNDVAVVSAAGTAYYSNVKLAANPNGGFNIVSGELRNLASVDEIEVHVIESAPVEVSVEVTGILSIACVALEEPAVSRKGNTFTVVLAETPIDPLALCVAAIKPYEISIPLDVAGLEAGEYTVIVNDVETGFTLAADQI